MGSIWKENYKRGAKKDSISAVDNHDLIRIEDQGALTTNASGIAGTPVSSTPPGAGEILQFDGVQYTPVPAASGGGGEDLAATLALGNTTGANDIVISSSQVVRGVNGTTGTLATLQGGASTGVGVAGASVAVFGGPATDGDGGDVFITGRFALGTSREGGLVEVAAGAGSAPAGVGGAADLIGGSGGGSGSGGVTGCRGGVGGLTGPGGDINITGGTGGATSGDAGDVNIAGGTQTSGTEGAVNIATAINLLGFHAATPVTKQTVTGSRGGNAALASLLTALDALGLITDSSSA